MSSENNDVGPKRFELVRPFEHRGQRYTEFTMREPKVRDLRKFLKAVDSDAILAMERSLADLAGVDDPVMSELSIKDFGIMKKWFEGFLLDMMTDSET